MSFDGERLISIPEVSLFFKEKYSELVQTAVNINFSDRDINAMFFSDNGRDVSAIKFSKLVSEEFIGNVRTHLKAIAFFDLVKEDKSYFRFELTTESSEGEEILSRDSRNFPIAHDLKDFFLNPEVNVEKGFSQKAIMDLVEGIADKSEQFRIKGLAYKDNPIFEKILKSTSQAKTRHPEPVLEKTSQPNL